MVVTYLDLLRERLPTPEEEGTRGRPYLDSFGNWTIGVGHNLTACPLPQFIIDALLDWDIQEAEKYARFLLPDFDSLSDVRKYVVCDMAFNLGSKLQGFHKFLLAVHEQRWVDAAIEMLDSDWHHQVGTRAERLAEAMRTDSL